MRLDSRGTLLLSMNAPHAGFGFTVLAGYSYPATGGGPAR